MITRLVSLGLLLTASIALAQEPASPEPKAPPTQPSLQAQLDELRAQQAALQARLAAAEARASAAPPDPGHRLNFTAAPGRGLVLSLGDAFSLSLRPRVQIRDTLTIDPGGQVKNELHVRTLRLWLQGHVLTPHLGFAIQLAFGGHDGEVDGAAAVLDAWVEYARLRDLRVRVGQFFVPFDRGRTTLELGMQLPERAQVLRELGLDRDVGIVLSSTDLFGSRGILGYALGVFGGEGKNRVGGARVGFLYVARVTVTPFGPFDDHIEGDLQRLRRPRLAIGVGGAYNQATDRQGSTTGAILSLGTFDYGHAAADVVFKCAGVSVLAEVLYRQARQGSLSALVNGAEVREWSRSAFGYLVQAGVMVHSRVELSARFNELIAIGDTDPALLALVRTRGREVGGGLNVFVNGHAFKIQADYAYLFGERARAGQHAIHLQLDASF
jgi:hypothetical protein